MKKFLALSLSDVVFIMLINVTILKIAWHFNIYEQDKFGAQLSSFITSFPDLLTQLVANRSGSLIKGLYLVFP